MDKTTVVNLRLSQYDTYIGRGSKWGNPFKIGVDGTREEVLKKFYKYAVDKGLDKEAKQLKGKVLGCFCKPNDCHGDFLADWANRS